MSFAYFDNILTLLSEELNVPLPKLQQAWTNSFAKFYKADASILQPTKKGGKTTTAKAVEKAKPEEKSKLPTCQDPGCTTGVKNQDNMVEGKLYCSKHLKKAQNAVKKAQAAPCEYVFPKDNKKAGKQCGNHAQPDGKYCKNHGGAASSASIPPEEDEKSESSSKEEEDQDLPETLDDDHSEVLESDEETDPAELLVELRKGLDEYMGRAVTKENVSKLGTMEKYVTFFKTNWHNFQKIYPALLSISEVEQKVQQKKIQKWDLVMLLEQNNSKLEHDA